ncbi:FBD-associated F-box protein [Rhynchospora pubera]|uniref:FBD-associated F-box protein n=1 Tax=Rhynchospora pubera TaxID=906938 RepID=A0AAV8GP88_9POAL|nr:FBD-associated F-box protein [Rhynchospora pubera]
MANSPSVRRRRADGHEPDRLSNLSDELLIIILSLLPTRMAARTSVLSRRFQHLWKASLSVDLTANQYTNNETFEAAASSAILSREPSNSLLSLTLDLSYAYDDSNMPYTFFTSLLVKARSLGLRHLTIRSNFWDFHPIIPTIFSIDSLESLHLPAINSEILMAIPSNATLPQLKSLSFFWAHNSVEFNQLLSKLSSVQYLGLEMYFTRSYSLSSQTIRKLELDVLGCSKKVEFFGLSIPSLEVLVLHLEIGQCQSLPRIEGDMPFLTKAIIVLEGLHKGDIGAVDHLLNCVSNVEDLSLSLDIKESAFVNEEEKYPFPVLLEPGKAVPDFPNLKHLDVKMCFHEPNLGSFIALLHHSPALESVKLVHKVPRFTGRKRTRKKKDWVSKLPRNVNGIYNYLNLGENKKELLKLLDKNVPLLGVHITS